MTHPDGRVVRTAENGRINLGISQIDDFVGMAPINRFDVHARVESVNGSIEVRPILNRPVSIIRRMEDCTTLEIQVTKNEILKPGDRIRIGKANDPDHQIYNFDTTESPRLSRSAQSRRNLSEQRSRELENHFQDEATDAARNLRVQQVEQMFRKFDSETITVENLEAIIRSFPREEQELVTALLARCAHNSSDAGIFAQMKALRDVISPNGEPPPPIFTLSANSAGNGLGYIFRKANRLGNIEIRNIDELVRLHESGAALPQRIVIFDDVSKSALSQQQRLALSQIDNVTVADLNAFERGVNFIDFAKGNEAIVAKLRALLNDLPVEQRTASSLEAADYLLRGAIQRSELAASRNVTIVRPPENLHVPGMPDQTALAAMTHVNYLHTLLSSPRWSRDQFAEFLARYPIEARDMISQMVVDGSTYYSLANIVRRLSQLNRELRASLDNIGSDWSHVNLVTDLDSGGSAHLMTYLFSQVSDAPVNTFVSQNLLRQRMASVAPNQRTINGIIDDTIYSGTQQRNLLGTDVFSNADYVLIGSLGHFRTGMDAVLGARQNGLIVNSITEHHNFYSEQNPFWASLTSRAQQRIARDLADPGGYGGFGQVQGSLIWSYMFPDNNVSLFQSNFSGNTLGLASPHNL